MKLLCATTSPYSSKVRMAARYLELDVTEIRVDTNAGPAILVDNNPLGKIPTLLTDDGASVFDSIAIMHYFHRLKKKKLYPDKNGKRTEAEILEALCDGITDCLLSIVYEKRTRPPEMQYQPWIDRQWAKVVRGLDHLNANLPKTTKKLHGGHFALAALIGYLDLRFAGQWEKGRGKLKGWPKKFEKFFPELAGMKPQQ